MPELMAAPAWAEAGGAVCIAESLLTVLVSSVLSSD
jgi:hypothetical protein